MLADYRDVCIETSPHCTTLDIFLCSVFNLFYCRRIASPPSTLVMSTYFPCLIFWINLLWTDITLGPTVTEWLMFTPVPKVHVIGLWWKAQLVPLPRVGPVSPQVVTMCKRIPGSELGLGMHVAAEQDDTQLDRLEELSPCCGSPI